MSNLPDRAKDFWDRISPRERRLVAIAAVAVPVTLAIWLGLSIRDGLVAMEARNDDTRKALRVLADLRARGETRAKVDDAVSMMGTEPLSLATYIDNAAKKAQITLKSTLSPHPAVTKNGFVTNSLSTTLDDLTIEQLKTFLMEVEMGSKVVAVTHLNITRDFRDKAKLDVQIEVSTYSKEPPTKSEGGGGSAGSATKKDG